MAPTRPATAMRRRKTPTAMTPPMMWMLDTRPRPLPQAATPMSNKPTSYREQSRLHLKRTLVCSTAKSHTGSATTKAERTVYTEEEVCAPTRGQNGWEGSGGSRGSRFYEYKKKFELHPSLLFWEKLSHRRAGWALMLTALSSFSPPPDKPSRRRKSPLFPRKSPGIPSSPEVLGNLPGTPSTPLFPPEVP